MAARKVNTPGATPKPEEKEVTQPTTAQQTDAALESITGKGPEPQDQSTNETSSVSEPVELVPDPRIDQILESQARIEKKLDALLKAGKIEAPSKKRWVQGKNGLEHKEV
jgi:hypothetical protein